MSHSDQCFRRLKGGLDRVRGVLLSWGGSFIGKKKKRLGKLLLYAFFGLFGGREIGESLKVVKVWTKQFKVPFCIFFGIGLDCTWGGSISLLDFVNWLNPL